MTETTTEQRAKIERALAALLGSQPDKGRLIADMTDAELLEAKREKAVAAGIVDLTPPDGWVENNVWRDAEGRTIGDVRSFFHEASAGHPAGRLVVDYHPRSRGWFITRERAEFGLAIVRDFDAAFKCALALAAVELL